MRVSTGKSLHAAIVGVLYFAVFLVVALFGHDDPPFSVTPQTSLDQLADNTLGLPFGDPASFATAARDLAKTGALTPDHAYIFRLWPPGISILEAALARVIGTSGPLILCLQIISVTLLTMIAMSLRGVLRAGLPIFVATVLPLSLVAFPMFRLWFLEPSGIMFSDALAIEWFVLALLLALPARDRLTSCRRAVIAGLCLAIAAYFRPYVETIVVVATCLAVGLAALRWLPLIRCAVPRQTIASIALVLLTAHLLMLPWRLHNMADSGNSVPAWASTFVVIAQNSLATHDTLLAAGGKFVIDGGGDLACAFEPAQCGATDQPVQRMLGVFVRHMPDWIGRKLAMLDEHWFAPLLYFSGMPATPDTDIVNIGANTLTLVLLFALPFLLFLARRHPAVPLLALMTLAILASYAVIMTLVQIEARYFNFLKVYIVVVAMISASLNCQRQPGLTRWQPSKWVTDIRSLLSFG